MITMKQLADELNLSRSTVAYALTHQWRNKRVSPATREMVLRKADQLGYRPNRVATSLRTRKTNTIGVLVPTIASDFVSQMLHGVDATLGDTRTILLGVSDWDSRKEHRVLQSFEERMVDGIIALTSGHRAALPVLSNLLKRGTPLVQVEHSWPELQTDVVVADNESFGYQLAEHLIGLGHQRIAYLRSPRVHAGTLARAAGYERAMREHGFVPLCLPAIPTYSTGSRFEFTAQLVRQYLSQSKPPFAIVANDFGGMLSALQVIEEHGYRCPEDVSICGGGMTFELHGAEGIPLSRFLRVQFTRMDWSVEEMGRKAATLLLKRLEQDPFNRSNFQRITIPGHLVVGSSTTRPGTKQATVRN